MILNQVTFMKYPISVVSLMFLPKTLIWNKTTLPASNSYNFAELVESELMKSFSKNIHRYSFFCQIHLFIVKILRAYNYRTR